MRTVFFCRFCGATAPNDGQPASLQHKPQCQPEHQVIERWPADGHDPGLTVIQALALTTGQEIYDANNGECYEIEKPAILMANGSLKWEKQYDDLFIISPQDLAIFRHYSPHICRFCGAYTDYTVHREGCLDANMIERSQYPNLAGLTVMQARELTHGQTLHHKRWRNADGTPQRWRVNGKVKTWKRDASRLQIPIKYGLYQYAYLTTNDLDAFEMDADTALTAP